MKRNEWFRVRARELYHEDGEIEVDGNARVSTSGDEGAYVEAWVWVPSEPNRKPHSTTTESTGSKTNRMQSAIQEGQ